MIQIYTGVPGSGKSYHLASTIKNYLEKGVNVISNFNVDTSLLEIKKRKKAGQFIYVDNGQWRDNAFRPSCKACKDGEYSSIVGLINYARNFHQYYITSKGEKKYSEHQTILVFDECQNIWNSREWARKDRLLWNKFFCEHRKFGFDCIFTTQDDRLIDKQIRALFEDEFFHRKMWNFVKNETFSSILRRIFGEWFVCIKKKYGMKKSDAKMNVQYICAQKKIFNFYNSSTVFAFNVFDDFVGVLQSEKEFIPKSKDELWAECVKEFEGGRFTRNAGSGATGLSGELFDVKF